jgi:hypothetical protein
LLVIDLLKLGEDLKACAEKDRLAQRLRSRPAAIDLIPEFKQARGKLPDLDWILGNKSLGEFIANLLEIAATVSHAGDKLGHQSGGGVFAVFLEVGHWIHQSLPAGVFVVGPDVTHASPMSKASASAACFF